MKKTNLTPEELLKTKFSTELSGYNADEVDKFLDLILEDYHEYIENTKRLNFLVDEKNALVNDKDDEIEKLKIEIANVKEQLSESNKHTNYELVKKIDELTEYTKNSNKK